MDRAQKIDEQLAALAVHLAARREAIMQAWRKAVDRDPEMTTGASLPRAQLNDHIPELLAAFGDRLTKEELELYGQNRLPVLR